MKKILPLSLLVSTLAYGQTTEFRTGNLLTSGTAGIGATPGAGQTLRAGKNVTGATGSSGVVSNGPVQSDVTASYNAYTTNVQTAAAAFTVAVATHYNAFQGTIGAGSAVTVQNGFDAGASLTGATSNYGFRGEITSGAGRFNMFMDGNADNAIAGNVRIGSTTAPTKALDVTGAIAGSGALTLPGLASSSAATTGTLCWTTGTGNVNVDTTVACLASTRRVKEKIVDLDIGLNEVMRMRPVSYDLRTEFNPEHLGRQVGMVAEEMQEIDSRLVALDGGGQARGIRYMQLTAVLVKSIQTQQNEIHTLMGVLALFGIFNIASFLRRK